MSDDQPKNVIEAIARVMAELPAIGKDERMQGTGGQATYNYRGIESITKEAQVLFGRYGIVPIPSVESFETREIQVNQKPWQDLTMKVRYTLYGPGDTQVTAGPFVAMARENSDKGANKCMTQAYKQMLLQVLMVSDKADDGDAQRHERDAVQQDPLVTEDMVQRFYVTAAKDDFDENDVRAMVGGVTGQLAEDPSSLRMSQWPRLRDQFRKAKAAKESASPVTPQGEGAPAPEASTEAPRAVSEGAPPAPTEPEPQPAGGRGRARIGSKASEEG